jgi:hypothetical protein
LLDEFLATHGERLIDDPLKRAFLQRDLWAVFDHLVGQNVARYGDGDLLRRGAVDRETYGDDANGVSFDDPEVMQRREILGRKLAVIIQRLALPAAVIRALPDNYAAAIQSGQFASRHDLDCQSNYLPPGLLTCPDEWVEIDTSPEPLNFRVREGQIDYVAWFIRGRSYYRIFWRFPDGRKAVEEYLKYLREEGVDWEQTARNGRVLLKSDARQIPVGTEAAIVQSTIVLDDRLVPVPTRLVESLRVSVYKNVTGTPDPATNTGLGLIGRVYAAQRRLLFDNLKQGGLARVPDDAPTYQVLLSGSKDWGHFGRQQSVVQTCVHCHMHWKEKTGVFTLLSIFCFAPNGSMPGIVIPMGYGDIPTLPRSQRIAHWKQRQEDYLRLVEYARGVPSASEGRTALADSRKGYITAIPPESSESRAARHRKIAQRRSGPTVIVHRGAWAFAPENTLEAYAAAMDCGADGCEVDIRRTADGVLVMFHDDGLDRMTDALGRSGQYTYAELLAVRFRSAYGAHSETRIPTLAAVLELARQRAMLLHLDVKEPGLEEDIAKLLDAADVWDHVVEINEGNATTLRKSPKAQRLAYKAFGWREGRMDMNPERVRDGLARPGQMIMVDDPRVAARELTRKTLHVPLPDNLRVPLPANLAPAVSQNAPNSSSPAVFLSSLANRVDSRSLDELGKLLAADFPERTELEGDAAHQQQRARRIVERAWAAQQIGHLGDRSTRAVKLLEDLVAHRSLHHDWGYSGLDGAMATRALGVLNATQSVPFLVRTFLAVDPELKKLVKPPANYSYAWAEYRLKREIMCVLGELPCDESKRFLRDYLALDEATAGKSAAPLFEEATRALLRHEVTARELEDLFRSPNSAVRGTTILVCLDEGTASRAAALGKIIPWTQELPHAEN